MKHYDIAIYSNNKIELSDNNIIYLDSSYELIDSYLARKENEEISFDYLITNSKKTLKDLGAVFDNGFALTNSLLQTTIENTFAFGEIVNLNKGISEELEIILDAIYEK